MVKDQPGVTDILLTQMSSTTGTAGLVQEQEPDVQPLSRWNQPTLNHCVSSAVLLMKRVLLTQTIVAPLTASRITEPTNVGLGFRQRSYVVASQP